MNHNPARRRAARLLPLALLLLPACQQEMAVQPAIRPDEPSTFFKDGRANRPPVPGTVARGHLRSDRELYAGMRTVPAPPAAGAAAVIGAGNPLAALGAASAQTPDYVKEFPFPVTEEVLRHGQNRYMIYCVVCHDPLGTGNGKIVERGYTKPPSYHIDRLREVPVGHFYDVMTRGYGSMPEYRAQVPPRDRWAIAAYIRALQLSQHCPKELADEMRRNQANKGEAAGGQP